MCLLFREGKVMAEIKCLQYSHCVLFVICKCNITACSLFILSGYYTEDIHGYSYTITSVKYLWSVNVVLAFLLHYRWTHGYVDYAFIFIWMFPLWPIFAVKTYTLIHQSIRIHLQCTIKKYVCNKYYSVTQFRISTHLNAEYVTFHKIASLSF